MPDTPERRTTGATPPAAASPGGAMQGSQSGSGSARPSGEQSAGLGAQIGSLTEEARSRSRQLLQERTRSAAEQLAGIARALKQSAEQCRQQEGQQAAGRVLEQAATGLEQLSDMLRQRDVDSLFDQAGSLLRRQPALFVGGAVAVGFLLSRFFKSSGVRQRDRGEYDEAYEGMAATPEEEASRRYVTGAHADPDEVAAGDRAADSAMPGGRDF